MVQGLSRVQDPDAGSLGRLLAACRPQPQAKEVLCWRG